MAKGGFLSSRLLKRSLRRYSKPGSPDYKSGALATMLRRHSYRSDQKLLRIFEYATGRIKLGFSAI